MTLKNSFENPIETPKSEGDMFDVYHKEPYIPRPVKQFKCPKAQRKEIVRSLAHALEGDTENLTAPKKAEIIEFILETPRDVFETDSRFRLEMLQRLALWGSNRQIYQTLDTRRDILEFIVEYTKVHARTDFYTFVKLMANCVIPNAFKSGRHIEIICESLQSLYESYENPKEDTERVQVFLPPRSMKSVLCSILFPAWVLGRNPKFRILLVGGSVQTAVDVFGRPLKNLISSPEYQTIFPETKLDPKASSAQRFFTTDNGGYFCGGASTGIAGRGGDFIICDDMLTEQNAFSKAERTKINNNYIPGIRSRSQPGAAELMVNTRWHLEDPSGYLLKIDEKSDRPWKVISVPAILDHTAVSLLKKPEDPPGRFSVGDSYWPEYKPLKEILDLKEGYHRSGQPYKWNALYMQNPVPDEGNIVKHDDWKVWPEDKDPPEVSQIIVSMDTAFSEKERADFSAYTVWGIFYKDVETLNMGIQRVPQMVLLYSHKGKWNMFDLCNECETLRETFKPDYFLIEKKASGQTLLQELYRRGFPVVEYDPRGKKEERLQAASVILKMGRVWAPLDKEWARLVVEEVCSFPSAAHDDLTDTVSQAVVYMRDMGVIRHEGYDYEDPEDEDSWADSRESGGGTYWSALV
jgi:predicted phage terminase large subunit-like protein